MVHEVLTESLVKHDMPQEEEHIGESLFTCLNISGQRNMPRKLQAKKTVKPLLVLFGILLKQLDLGI